MIAGAMSAWTRAPSLVVVASMLCASCAWQPRDATTYAAKGREAAAQGRSAAATGAVTVEGLARGTLPRATAVVILREAEAAAAGGSETFGRFQPPGGATQGGGDP